MTEHTTIRAHLEAIRDAAQVKPHVSIEILSNAVAALALLEAAAPRNRDGYLVSARNRTHALVPDPVSSSVAPRDTPGSDEA